MKKDTKTKKVAKKENKVEVILHPVRFQIIKLLAVKQLTPKEMIDQLTDVPQATMYRHINKLLKHGILTEVQANQKRGTLEKVYALSKEGGLLRREELENCTSDQHMDFFARFALSLIFGFNRYMSSPDSNFTQDKITYLSGLFYLSDEEADEVKKKLIAIFEPYKDNADNKKLYNIGLTLFPSK